MARMFTLNHRARHYRSPEAADFHGEVCESLYIEGMAVLSDMKDCKLAIGLLRRPNSIHAKNRKKLRRCSELARVTQLNMTEEALIEKFKACGARLKIIRLLYTEAHSRRHNMPRMYVLSDAGGNEIERFVRWEAARHYQQGRAPYGSSIDRAKETK